MLYINTNKSRKYISSLFQFIIPFIVVIIIWEFLSLFNIIIQLPAPSSIFSRFIELSYNNILYNHITSSLYRLMVGYFLALIFGIILGTIMGIKKSIADIFSPLLSLLISVPTIAWVPVLLITFGLGDKTVIMAIFLGGFFAITYSTMHGIRMVNKSLINASRIMGGNRFNLFRHVLLPGSLVSLMPGLRLAIGYSWRALVGAEMLAAMLNWGVGKMIYGARFWNDVELMFLGLVIIGIAGLSFDYILMRNIEKFTIEKWGMITEG